LIREFLIRDLEASSWVASSSSRIDDQIPVILVVLVSATDDDRVRPRVNGTRDAVLERAVHSCVRELAPIGICRADGISANLSKRPWHPEDPLPLSGRRGALTAL
jgi:hypothetical protein